MGETVPPCLSIVLVLVSRHPKDTFCGLGHGEKVLFTPLQLVSSLPYNW